jgi:polyhydroxyalkanoate synthesis regulator phasin
MLELFKKGIYTGVGLGILAKEKAEETAKQLVKEAKLSKDESEKFISEFMKNSETAAKELEQKISSKVKCGIDKLNITNSKEIEELKSRIEQLEAELSELKK